jgi:hypothetical protein
LEAVTVAAEQAAPHPRRRAGSDCLPGSEAGAVECVARIPLLPLLTALLVQRHDAD